MAANKPKKSSTKKSKTQAKKPAVKSEKTEKPALEAKETKVEKVETKVEKVEKVEKEEVKKTEKKCPVFFKNLFARKCDDKENILTIFQNKKIWGALIGEAMGTMILSIVFLTLGVYQPLYMFFVMLGATMLTFGLSGANLNPIVTAGMMASRRMSAIRGVLYILAQILGAWIGYLIISAFYNAGTMTATLPEMAAVENEMFWVVTMIEFFGAGIIGFAFARALQFKNNALAFAATVAGGFVVAFVAVIVISSTFMGLEANFIMNPAVALMYQILPTGGDNAADLLADIALALVTYVVFPVLGGIVGFYLSDVASVFNEEKM